MWVLFFSEGEDFDDSSRVIEVYESRPNACKRVLELIAACEIRDENRAWIERRCRVDAPIGFSFDYGGDGEYERVSCSLTETEVKP